MKILEVNRSDKKGIKKEPIGSGKFIEDFGLENDAHAGKWHRQVSLLAIESYHRMEEQGIKDLPIGAFGENLTTEGIELHTLPVGTVLKIGETVQEVTQIGKECHTMCNIGKTVGTCVMPNEGIFTKIIKGGEIKKGDKIEIELP
ncbi:MAG: MOSC domain-containing protein [Andreesenia angusta]|nr:MOSC domain-containing protein [Andreesenia angusta]